MGFENPFGFPIFVEEIENGKELASMLCDTAYSLRNGDPHGKLISDAWNDYKRAESQEDFDTHGYTSHGSYNLLSDQRFDKLHDAVVTQVEKYTNYHDINPSFHITNSWVSIYGNGHFVPEHIHPRSHLSCVFYGAATEGTGEIVFKNPAKPSYAMQYGRGVTLFNDYWPVSPKAGQMIIFPSHIAHYTNKHEANEDRIIFSGNIVFDQG